MEKAMKTVLILLLTALLAGCVNAAPVAPPDTPAQSVSTAKTVNASPKPSASVIQATDTMDEQAIKVLFKSTRSQTIKSLGSSYTSLDKSAVKDWYIQYEMPELRLVFRTIDAGTAVDYLFAAYAGNSFSYKNVKNGMDFAGIQQLLGKADVQKTWGTLPHEVTYKLIYPCDGFYAVFASGNPDGTDAQMAFFRYTDMEDVNTQNSPVTGCLKGSDIITKGGVTADDISRLGDYSWTALNNRLDPDCELVDIGPEDNLDGYYYRKLGITMAVEAPESTKRLNGKPYTGNSANELYFIRFDNKSFILKGVNEKTDFDGIEKKLGKGKHTSQKEYYDGGSGMAYTLSYPMGNASIRFTAYDKEGRKGWRCEAFYADYVK